MLLSFEYKPAQHLLSGLPHTGMLIQNRARCVSSLPIEQIYNLLQYRSASTQSVQLLSKLFSPTLRLDAIPADNDVLRSYSLLVHGGFLRQVKPSSVEYVCFL